MPYTIAKTFTFSAAHHLPHLPPEHKCARPHGHNYAVVLLLESDELDERGFVVDYAELDLFKSYLDTVLDHRDLNEVFDFPTTAENIVRRLYLVAKALFGEKVYSVRVSETPNTWAEFMEY